MIDSLLYVSPILMLFIVVAGICYLCKLGFHHISLKGRCGPTSAEFTANRNALPPQHEQELSKALPNTVEEM